MKISNSLLHVVVITAALIMGGCVSTAGMGAKQARMTDKAWDKEAYGMVFYATDKDSRAIACHGVGGDPRCLDDNYVPVLMAVSFGFSDGGRGLFAMAHKDELKDFVGGNASKDENKACTPRNTSKCFWGKFNIKPSGLADFAGIVSKPQEKSPCHWNGLPGAGGTVCESLGFDYRKANLPLVRNF